MRGDPVRQLLAPHRLGVGEAGGAEHGDKDLHRHDLAGVGVDHLASAAGEIDEHALAAPVDPRRAAFLAEAILDAAARHGFDRDLGLVRREGEEAVKVLDAHLCDLKELQIRDGLHVFGLSPEGDQLTDLLVALTRVPRRNGEGADASLIRALAKDLELEFDPLTAEMAAVWTGPRPQALMPGDSEQSPLTPQHPLNADVASLSPIRGRGVNSSDTPITLSPRPRSGRGCVVFASSEHDAGEGTLTEALTPA